MERFKQDEAHKELISSFRFTEYHEPLKRWPFDVDDKIAKKIKKHGSFPKLLLEKSATKGIPNKLDSLHKSPSDRIASNYTPSAKHLRVASLRDLRISLRRKRRSSIHLRPKEVPRPARREVSLTRRPDLVQQEITVEIPDDDSVKRTTKDKRKRGGQAQADRQLIKSLTHLKPRSTFVADDSLDFIFRFPYKSCQRSTTERRKVLSQPVHIRKRLMQREAAERERQMKERREELRDIGPTEQLAIAQSPGMELRRQAMIADEEVKSAIRTALTRAGLTTLAGVKFERKILKLRTMDGREELDVVPASDVEEVEDVDDIIADDGTLKRPPLRRGALVPDEETRRAIRSAVAKAGYAALGAVRLKRRSKSAPRSTVMAPKPLRIRKHQAWPAEASQPCSPTRQLLLITKQRKDQEVSPEDLQRYVDYVKNDVSEENLPKLGKKQMARIRSKLKKHWFTNLMMKKTVTSIKNEIQADYTVAVKKAIVNYVLMDEEERRRVNIESVPSLSYRPSIIRAPVPWRQSYLVSKQFCRHNLFITNPVVLKLTTIWNNRFYHLRFVQLDQLTNQRGDPLSPLEMKARIFDQCETARNTLLKVKTKEF